MLLLLVIALIKLCIVIMLLCAGASVCVCVRAGVCVCVRVCACACVYVRVVSMDKILHFINKFFTYYYFQRVQCDHRLPPCP